MGFSPVSLSLRQPPAPGRHVVHTQSLFFGKSAFGSAHPLRVSAAVHVKTALNSPTNCWHTSVGASPSSLCCNPGAGGKCCHLLQPWGHRGATTGGSGGPDGSAHTSPTHPSCCWGHLALVPGPLQTLPAEPGRALPLLMKLVCFLGGFSLKQQLPAALIPSISASAIVKALRWD